MNNSIYLLTLNSGFEKAQLSYSVLEKMKQTAKTVGYFKPIYSCEQEKNHTINRLSGLGVSCDESFLYSTHQVMVLQNEGKLEDVFHSIMERYQRITGLFDMVLVEASDLSYDNLFETHLNISVSRGLNIPVILADDYSDKDKLQAQVSFLLSEKVSVLQVFSVSLQKDCCSDKAMLKQKFPSIDFSFLSEPKLTDQVFDDMLKGMNHFVGGGVSPEWFQYEMVEKARKAQKHIVLPEGCDDRVLIAASKLASDKIVRLTVLGDELKIRMRVKELSLNWDEQRIRIVDPVKAPCFDSYAEKLYELRKSKGLDIESARKMMQDVSYFGTMMVYLEDADGMVSGAVNTTAHTIRPSLQFVKTKPGVSTVSSVFFMMLPDRVVVYADCAIVPNPTAEQLAEIAITSSDTAKTFGIDPKVALLSYSSGNSGSGPDVDKVREATEIVKNLRPDLCVEGPIQYDAAVDANVASKKMPFSPVAGKANVLIFPDLNAGNNAYKAVQRETGSLAIGPVLQGLRKPVNDLSRGALIGDIYNTVLITALQSEN